MQRKNNDVVEPADLQFSYAKTKSMKTPDSNSANVLKLAWKAVEEVSLFTYLGGCSTLKKKEEERVEERTRIAKTAVAFRVLN